MTSGDEQDRIRNALAIASKAEIDPSFAKKVGAKRLGETHTYIGSTVLAKIGREELGDIRTIAGTLTKNFLQDPECRLQALKPVALILTADAKQQETDDYQRAVQGLEAAVVKYSEGQ